MSNPTRAGRLVTLRNAASGMAEFRANALAAASGGPREVEFRPNLAARHRAERIWRAVFFLALGMAVVALAVLLLSIANNVAGLVAVQNEVDPATLAPPGVALRELPAADLAAILRARLSAGVLRRLEGEKPLAQRSAAALYALVLERVVEPKVVRAWPLFDSLLHAGRIHAAAAAYPQAVVSWNSWLDAAFLLSAQSPDPGLAGVRTALLGSLWLVGIAVAFALPLGVAAAVYLEEYAADNALNRVIQTNINNLAGVPSIIYGLLGLAVFVRMLGTITRGRTVLSAGLTMGLLILPVFIINAQEALRAVPGSLKEASLGLGATHWQTVWHHLLPAALPGILTGTILAISRAIGETAPLVVVGAATYITVDPSGPFSRFTALPIQIYQWTARPQDVFRNIAAAASVVLLALLLSLNAAAIVLRNRASRRT